MARIGYYAMDAGQGVDAMLDDIRMAGHDPVLITVPNAAQLAGVDALYVWNGNNSAYGKEFLASFSDITKAVQGGMDMVVFDRAIGIMNPQKILPGTSLKAVRYTSADADLTAAGEKDIGHGPAGGVDDKTLDGGNYSVHGYVEAATLPKGATVLMTPGGGTESQAVGFVYEFGQGMVQYYGVPMDFYNEQRQGWENLAVNTLNFATLCLGAGTAIATRRGQVPVQALVAGDLVATRDHGWQVLRGLCVETRPSRGVILPRGAIGNRRPLHLSAQHRILLGGALVQLWHGVDEVLVPAAALSFLARPVQVTAPMYNLLFDRHEVICTEGAAVESLLVTPRSRTGIGRGLRAVQIGRAMQPARLCLTVAEGRRLAQAMQAAGQLDRLHPARAMV